jgi:alkylation response protein AidB-like acyl-CoA dehydrogenase
VDKARLLSEVTAARSLGEVEADTALDAGALAAAAQLVGLGGALLDRSVAYAKQRSQFGAPIGSFQAVKHQLADVAVALELARPLLFGAALAGGAPSAARDVSAAKVAAADAAYRAARAALQVHGAIGYTAEYDLALWLTKVRALVSAWGTQRFHHDRVLAAVRRG